MLRDEHAQHELLALTAGTQAAVEGLDVLCEAAAAATLTEAVPEAIVCCFD